MKILFDTNIYVSEFAFGRTAGSVLKATIVVRWKIFVSDHILNETYRVLYEDFAFSARAAFAARKTVKERSTSIHPAPSRHRVPAEVNDSPILQAALAAGVGYLVSSDKHLLSLHPYEGLRIVSLAAYRQILINEGHLTSSNS